MFSIFETKPITCKKEKHEWINLEVQTFKPKRKKALEYVEELTPALNEFLKTVDTLSDKNISVSFFDDRKDDEISDFKGEYFERVVPHNSGSATFRPKSAQNGSIKINMYNTASIVHEFGHLLDVESDGDPQSVRWSERDDFKMFLEAYSQALAEKDVPKWYYDYCTTPTEVFARLFQEWHKDLFGENKLTEVWHYEIGDQVSRDLYKSDYRIGQYFNSHLPKIYEKSQRYQDIQFALDLAEATIADPTIRKVNLHPQPLNYFTR